MALQWRAESAASHAPQIFTRRLVSCEEIPSSEVTDRLELTRSNVPPLGIRTPLLDSVRNSQWVSLEGGRIVIEIRNPQVFNATDLRRISVIKGVDFDDCLASATKWHGAEYEMVEPLGVQSTDAKTLYEQSKILVPGKVTGEKRYTPGLNLLLLTTYTDLVGRGVDTQTALVETTRWKDAIVELVQGRNGIDGFGEAALARQAINPRIQALFLGNPISKFVYHDFANAVFEPQGPSAVGFIVTRGKIEGPLGQVYKVHTSGVLGGRRKVDMVIYTNDVKAETLIHLGSLMPEVARRKPIFMFDDNVGEILPYLQVARDRGMDNISVVQVAHPDAKRKDDQVGLTPARVITVASEGGDLFLRYFLVKPNMPLSGSIVTPI